MSWKDESNPSRRREAQRLQGALEKLKQDLAQSVLRRGGVANGIGRRPANRKGQKRIGPSKLSPNLMAQLAQSVATLRSGLADAQSALAEERRGREQIASALHQAEGRIKARTAAPSTDALPGPCDGAGGGCKELQEPRDYGAQSAARDGGFARGKRQTGSTLS